MESLACDSVYRLSKTIARDLKSLNLSTIELYKLMAEAISEPETIQSLAKVIAIDAVLNNETL